MTQITIGEVEWDAVSTAGDRDRASDFMKLEQGDNKGRILSNPQQFAVHWVVDETGKKRKVNCATTGCPVCLRGQDGDKPQARWLIKFFNRKENRVQLLEITSQIVNGVRDLVKNEDWGAVDQYDVTIKRAAPGTQPLYSVLPGRRAPLTGEERQALADFDKRVTFDKFITPPTPAAVAEKLGWSAETAQAKTVTNSFVSSGKTNGGAAKKPVVDFDFDQ